MSPPSPAESWKPARGGCAHALGVASLFVLIWLAFMQPVRTLAPSLDGSWQMMLGYARDHGLAYGRDLVPTMGPAGFLFTASSSVHHLGARFAWMLLGNAVLALIFLRLGLALGGMRRALYFLFLVLLLSPYAEAMQGLALLVLGLALLRPELGSRPARTAVMAAALGWLALFKFTHFTLAAVLVAIAAAHALRRHGAPSAGAILGGFVLGFVGGWTLLGQPLATLADFLRLSAEISGGYVDAMSLEESPRLFWCGVGTLAAGGLYAWTYWRSAADRLRAPAVGLMLAAAWFLNWKHGFVRADGHTLTLFTACLFTAVAFPALVQEPDTPALQRRLALVGLLALAGIWTGARPALADAVGTLGIRLRENAALVAELRHPRQLAGRLRAEFAQFGRDRALPRIAAHVGAGTVDVLGTEQAIAMFDNFHYTPRPVFQDYYACTPALARLNEAFYASPRAPQFVLQKYETIDGRLPGLDDARVRTLVMTHYTLAVEENGWLLWEKLTTPTALAPTSVRQLVTQFDTDVPVPAEPSGALWTQIEIRPTWFGRLRALLYKPPQLVLDVTDVTGSMRSYRLVRAMAADGFLLQPFFSRQAEIAPYFQHQDPPAVRTIRVSVPGGDRGCFAPELAVSFSRLPPLPRAAAPAGGARDPRYPMFSIAPVVVESPHPAGPYNLDGQLTFFIHAPGRVEFAPDPALTHVRGAVGLPPETYAAAGQTDGVEIFIEQVSPGGRPVVLWHRYLDPAHVPADRGLQSFNLDLPGEGRVVFRNLTGPQNNDSYDWTIWADVRFE